MTEPTQAERKAYNLLGEKVAEIKRLNHQLHTAANTMVKILSFAIKIQDISKDPNVSGLAYAIQCLTEGYGRDLQDEVESEDKNNANQLD